jgi:hypothetical protein
VVTQALGADHRIAWDARLVGVAAGAVALMLRSPTLVVLLVAALTTGIVRLVT